MPSIIVPAASAAPIILQADRVRRRISASDAVASLVASLAFGEPRRGDLGALAAITAERCASCSGAR